MNRPVGRRRDPRGRVAVPGAGQRAAFPGRRSRNRSAARLSLLIVALAVLALGCAENAMAPEESIATMPPRPSLPAVTGVSGALSVGVVVEEDDLLLRGNLFGADNDVGVVLAHSENDTQQAWFDFARELAEQGYAAFTFDFRGYGDTGGEKDPDRLDEDLRAALRFLRSDRGLDTVFLAGAGMGGTVSLVVAAQEEVAGVIAVSAPAQFEGQDALSAAGDIDAPTLLLASETDESISELFEAAAEPKERKVYPAGATGAALLGSESGADARERILRFLNDRD